MNERVGDCESVRVIWYQLLSDIQTFFFILSICYHFISFINCRDCLERLISQIDEDSDGNINQDEWVRLVAVMVTDEENDE